MHLSSCSMYGVGCFLQARLFEHSFHVSQWVLFHDRIDELINLFCIDVLFNVSIFFFIFGEYLFLP